MGRLLTFGIPFEILMRLDNEFLYASFELSSKNFCLLTQMTLLHYRQLKNRASVIEEVVTIGNESGFQKVDSKNVSY